MTVKCPRCMGTGDMGQLTSSRCRVCCGVGQLAFEREDQVMMFEWLEGFTDLDTDDDWLEKQLKKLMEARRKSRR